MYLSSEATFSICQFLAKKIEEKAGIEHEYYNFGESAFNNKAFMENTTFVDHTQQLFGLQWKKQRYHNLVRLGGDIVRSSLSEYHKATILGAFIWYAKNNLTSKKSKAALKYE